MTVTDQYQTEPGSTFVPDFDAIARASGAVIMCEQAVAQAEANAAVLADAEADAADDVAVAEAKVTDFSVDETKKDWQRAAADRDLAKRRRAHARAAQKLAAAEAAVVRAREDLARAHADLMRARSTPAAPAGDDPGLPPAAAPEVVRWVEQLTAYLESPEKSESVWCPQWQEHPEAVWRFTALREEFLIAMSEGEMSSWWVNHFDRHAPMLFGKAGIFESCRSSHSPDRIYRFAPRVS